MRFGELGDGGCGLRSRCAHWLRNDMVFTRGAVCGGTHGSRPTAEHFVGQGSCALPGVRCKAESPSHGFAVPAPFRQGGLGTRDADCHSQCAHWPRNDRGFTRGAVCGGTHGSRPTAEHFVGQGPCALPGVRCKAESPSHGCAVPAPFRQGGHGDGGCGLRSRCAHWLRNDSFIFPWRRY